MTEKTALSLVLKVAENAINMMAFSKKTPAQKRKYNRLKQAVKVLKEQVNG